MAGPSILGSAQPGPNDGHDHAWAINHAGAHCAGGLRTALAKQLAAERNWVGGSMVARGQTPHSAPGVAPGSHICSFLPPLWFG